MIKKIIKRICCRMKFQNVQFDSGSIADLHSYFEGYNKLGVNAELYKCFCGFGSYISAYSKIENAKIGRYCSIGKNVECIFGKHPTQDWVSTHPAFFSMRKQAGFTYVQEDKYIESAESIGDYSIQIGNDVWIGNRVQLMEGVTIGDGAIIAAGSVVTKDVEPYSIVGGVPAKLIRRRFEPEEIDFLLNLHWWDKEQKWIQRYSSYFSDIKILKNKLEEEE